jgi:hypothetical protein
VAISKKDASVLALTEQEQQEVARIEQMLDAAIRAHDQNGVHVSEQSWNPSSNVIAGLRALYEPGGWTLEVQPDRDGPIIWLR